MRALTTLVLGLGLCLLLSIAHAETSYGELVLSEAEAKEVSSQPLFKKRLGRVSLNLQNWKFGYGDFTDSWGDGRSHVERRIRVDFLNFLKSQFYESGIFPAEVKDRVALKVTLLDLKHESSVGASAEAKNPVTSGAVMTTKVSMRYEMVDQDTVVGAWEVNTTARSNSLNGGARLAESTDIALKRNLRSLLLRVIADLSPENSERAGKALAALGAEADNTRSLMEYVVLGVGNTANATSSVVWGTMTLMAQNSDVISAGLNSTAAQMQRNNQEFNQARNQAQLASRQQANSASKPTQKDEGRTAILPNSAAARANLELPKYQPQLATIGTVHSEQLAADKAAAEKVAAKTAAAEKAVANKAAAEARKAQQEADNKAQAEAKSRAETDYLQQLAGRTRLIAKNCYGEQHAMGQLPSIKPQVVSCVDIHFRAYCPGTAPSQAYQGAIKNMVGMGTGCFGDTAEIKPKLSCKADEIRVDVVRAASCS